MLTAASLRARGGFSAPFQKMERGTRHALDKCGAVSQHVPATPDAVKVSLVDNPKQAICSKACAKVGDAGSIEVNRSWWEGLDSDAKVCCIAHELAHTEGIACERCADTRAGAILRHWGFPRSSVAPAFSRIVTARSTAGEDALKGYDS